MPIIDNLFFKKCLVIFWCAFWCVTFLTDFGGALTLLGWVHKSWLFADNYTNLVDALKIYSPVHAIVVALFVGILLWSLLSTSLFIRATASLCQPKTVWFPKAQLAFIVTMLFWLSFFVADTIVYKFGLLENHMVQGGFELLCYLALYALPDES